MKEGREEIAGGGRGGERSNDWEADGRGREGRGEVGNERKHE